MNTMPPAPTPETATPFSLAGSVIVQIGGSGLLGRALVDAIGGAGAILTVASRRRDSLEAAAAAARARNQRVEAEAVDIGSESSIHALRDRMLARHGKIDGLVFNAVTRPMRGFDSELKAWQESMATNATGFFASVRAFGDAMASAGRGSIVNIASMMGMVGMNPWLYEDSGGANPPPDYFFHKGGMLNLTRYLASHYGPKGVRVNAVSPGGIYNPEKPQAAAFLERYGRMTMLGRMAEAREIGGAVVFLLSDAASYITGINLPVDGGYTAK